MSGGNSRKRDLSALIQLDMTPTEGVIIRTALSTMLKLGPRDMTPDEAAYFARTVYDQIDRIDRQLAQLLWPGERTKPPYPV